MDGGLEGKKRHGENVIPKHLTAKQTKGGQTGGRKEGRGKIEADEAGGHGEKGLDRLI